MASLTDGEALAGSAPTDTEWLFVEHPGPWGRTAADDLDIPVDPGTRVQLIRRPTDRRRAPLRPITLFAATLGALGAASSVRTASVATLSEIPAASWSTYDEALWLVCTNGKRDVCCAELGRPVAEALASRWPEGTWETTHLGGHRFSATLLALPSGVVLGRLDPASAVTAAEELQAGRLPLEFSRGLAGLPGRAQVADLHHRSADGLFRLDEVRVLGVDDTRVRLDTPAGEVDVEVTAGDPVPRRQSCADGKIKPAPTYIIGETVSRRPA